METKKTKKTMRGIEGTMHLWAQVCRGGIVSELLRANTDLMSPGDRTLAASLLYAAARRLSLWEEIRRIFLLPRPDKFSRSVQSAVLIGAAGLLELRNFAPAVLISSLIDWTKTRDPRGARVVNAVLRRILEEGPAELERLEKESERSLEALSLLCGVPLWAAQRWVSQYGEDEGRRIVAMNQGGASLCLRLSPDSPYDFPRTLEEAGWNVLDSDLPEGLRLEGTPLPSALPGYDEGFFTPQSESSILVGNAAAEFEGTRFLDLCAGRGVKTGEVLQMRPDITAEAWELSPGRSRAAVREMARLGLSERVTVRQGDALELIPEERPDCILVDAPCSGSGTWRRHPEGKWRQTEEGLEELSRLQGSLLGRAFSLVAPGGRVVYSTCSLLYEENEAVASRLLAEHPEMELLSWGEGEEQPDPENPGMVILPENPWVDGFYMAVFEKKKS